MENGAIAPMEQQMLDFPYFQMHIISKASKGAITVKGLTLYLIEKPFNAFANRADRDQAVLVRAA